MAIWCLISGREGIFLILRDYVQLLKEDKKHKLIDSVNDEFTLREKVKIKIVREPSQKRTIGQKIKQAFKSTDDDLDRLQSIDETIESLEKSLKRSNIHPDDAERIESILESERKERDRIKARIEKNKELVKEVSEIESEHKARQAEVQDKEEKLKLVS